MIDNQSSASLTSFQLTYWHCKSASEVAMLFQRVFSPAFPSDIRLINKLIMAYTWPFRVGDNVKCCVCY